MEINGKPAQNLLSYLKRDVAWLETVMGSGQLSANKLNLLKGVLANQREKLGCLLALELTEEKRRLLTCIIELMISAVIVLGLRGDFFFKLVEQQKLIQSAASMKELAVISDQLDQIKEDMKIWNK